MTVMQDKANEAFVRLVQERLGVSVDGVAGPITTRKFNEALPPKAAQTEKAVTGFTLSARSLKSLEGVHPKLVEVVKEAATLSTVPFVVTDGVRSVDGMWKAWGQGRTVAELKAKGCPDPAKYARPNDPKVTWLNNPLGSNHRAMSDGYGHAVDIYREPFNPKDDGTGFPAIQAAMNAAAQRKGVKIKNLAPKDRPHWELV